MMSLFVWECFMGCKRGKESLYQTYFRHLVVSVNAVHFHFCSWFGPVTWLSKMAIAKVKNNPYSPQPLWRWEMVLWRSIDESESQHVYNDTLGRRLSMCKTGLTLLCPRNLFLTFSMRCFGCYSSLCLFVCFGEFMFVYVCLVLSWCPRYSSRENLSLVFPIS